MREWETASGDITVLTNKVIAAIAKVAWLNKAITESAVHGTPICLMNLADAVGAWFWKDPSRTAYVFVQAVRFCLQSS